MNRQILKYFVILSLILGIILGLIAAIPYIGGVALFSTLFLSAPIVMLLLIMASKTDLTTPKDSIIQGAVIGFFVNITFSFTYSLVIALLYVIAKYTSNYILTSMVLHSPIWLFIIVIVFIGTLTAVTNAFSGFITYYIINLIRDIYERKQQTEINKWQNLNQK